MRTALRLVACQTMRQALLPIVDEKGLSSSILKMTAILLEQEDNLADLIGGWQLEQIGKYRSLCDFLLCSLFGKYRKPAHEFYNGRGKALREIESAWDIEKLDRMIYFSLIRLNQIREKRPVIFRHLEQALHSRYVKMKELF